MWVRREVAYGLTGLATVAASTDLAHRWDRPLHYDIYGPWAEIKTEPTFLSALVSIETHPNAGPVSDEFMITALREKDGRYVWGPQIFNAQGQLIYYNDPTVTGMGYQDPYFCSFYRNETLTQHLCASYETEIKVGHRLTIPKVYDSTYKQVDPSYVDIGELGQVEGHEFHMFSASETFVTTAYVKKKVGSLNLPGDEKFGDQCWIFDGCFQEIGTFDKNVLFSWCVADHMDLNEFTVNLSTPLWAARKFNENDPLDYVHINSVDKDEDGNYLVSLKMFSSVVKVAGINSKSLAPGSIVWRLGGTRSNFTMDPPESRFFFQHHVRYLPAVGGKTVISIFDNNCIHTKLCRNTSAKIFELQESTMQAKLVQRFDHPIPEDLENSEEMFHQGPGGSVDLLENGNIFVSWGKSQVSEFNRKTGQLIMHAYLGASNETFAYRAHRGRWTGKPVWKPKVLAYLKSCNDPEISTLDFQPDNLNVYVSWNGATEVKSWRISMSQDGTEGSFVRVGTYNHTDFETHISISCADISGFRWTTASIQSVKGEKLTAGCFPGWIVATAVDEYEMPLDWGRAEPAKVYVPTRHLLAAGTCDATSCELEFAYGASTNTVAQCASNYASSKDIQEDREEEEDGEEKPVVVKPPINVERPPTSITPHIDDNQERPPASLPYGDGKTPKVIPAAPAPEADAQEIMRCADYGIPFAFMLPMVFGVVFGFCVGRYSRRFGKAFGWIAVPTKDMEEL